MKYVFILSLFLLACSPAAPEGLAKLTLTSPDGSAIVLQVEVADEVDEQEQGLMNRTELGADRGMLFVFPEAEEQRFWMKNTLIPLDILFFNQDGVFVSSQSMEPCRNDPCQIYGSEGGAKYALEVRTGFVEQYSIERGWRLHMR